MYNCRTDASRLLRSSVPSLLIFVIEHWAALWNKVIVRHAETHR
jgi:hypothetical protein